MSLTAKTGILENYVYSQKILRVIDKNTLEKSLDKVEDKILISTIMMS